MCKAASYTSCFQHCGAGQCFASSIIIQRKSSFLLSSICSSPSYPTTPVVKILYSVSFTGIILVGCHQNRPVECFKFLILSPTTHFRNSLWKCSYFLNSDKECAGSISPCINIDSLWAWLFRPAPLSHADHVRIPEYPDGFLFRIPWWFPALTVGGCVCFIQQCHGLLPIPRRSYQAISDTPFVRDPPANIQGVLPDKAAQLSFSGIPAQLHATNRRTSPFSPYKIKLLQGTHSLFPVLPGIPPCPAPPQIFQYMFFNRPADIRCGKVSIRYRHEQIVHKLLRPMLCII